MFEAWVFGLTIVGTALIFAALGVVLVRRRISAGSLKSHYEVAGYLLSIVATLYSVLLGLIVVETLGNYQEAKAMSRQEADSSLDMFHIAYSLPLAVRRKIHHQLQEYLNVLVEQEWNNFTEDGSFNDAAKTAFRNIWWTLNDYEPATNREQSCYEKILDEMQDLTDGRRYRLQVVKQGLPAVMWGVLIAGGILTVVFTYLFEVEDAKAQVLMTSLVTLALTLNLLLVVLFNNPYKGYMRIPSYPFEYDRKVMVELLNIRPDR